MNPVREGLICALLAALCVLVVRIPALIIQEADATRQDGLRTLVKVTDKIDQDVIAEVDKVRVDLNSQIDATRAAAVSELGLTRQEADALAARVDARIEALGALANAQIDQQMGRANEALAATLAGTLDQVTGIRTDLAPTIEGVNLLMDRRALPAQVLGTLGAAKVTLGETAQTMRYVRDATPAMLDNVKGITASGQAIAGDVRRVADDWTAPKPWYRKLSSFAGDALHASSFFK